jgi:TRAP-type C4-dicarboxylate transport system permease small subunit
VSVRLVANRVATTLERLLDVLVGAMILVMAAAIIWQVFARYVLNAAPGWTEELSRYLMMWVTLLGGAAVLRSGGHIAVTALFDWLPRRAHPALLVLRDAAMLAALAILFWHGWGYAEINAVQESAAMEIRKSIIYAALPLGAALTMLMLVLARLAGAAFRTHGETDQI